MVDTLRNPLEMSDADISNMTAPPVAESVAQAAVEETPAADAVVENPPAVEEKPDVEKTPVEKTDGDENKPAGEENPEGDGLPAKAEEAPDKTKPEGEKPKGDVPDAGSKEGEAAAKTGAESTPVDYEAEYKKIMAPFKANGKDIKLENLDEVRQLMQQGANYTRKMQAIAPHRKLLTMMEANGLLSEDKLSFLIDLEKCDPAAVQKLLKDKAIDVMNIDTEAESNYTGGNHKVTDEDVQFRTNLAELSSTPEGTKTLEVVNAWDDASKEELWADPKLMPTIHEQRENGIYDRITAEVDRRRTLGKIAPEVSFIRAYASVGDEMAKANAFDDLAPASKVTTETPAKAEKVAVATTTAAPKKAVDNNDKAAAASTTQSSTTSGKAIVNPLAMSDKEFNEQFEKLAGRV